MPERPDLEYALPLLNSALAGSQIRSVKLHKPPVLRLAVPMSLEDALIGARIVHLRRQLHFVCVELASEHALELVIAPMLAGSLSVHPPGEGKRRDRALTLGLGDGRELRYRDAVQMGKVYVIPQGEYQHIPTLEPVGIDVLDRDAFTLEAFRALVRKRRDQIKVFLLDKRALDSLGNAYADEVLFAAGIHPKTFVSKLNEEEVARLHRAIPEVLRAASEEIARRKPATDEKLRDFLKVRNRHKQPCVVCGAPIRKAGVRGFDAFFCPQCQPETRKSGIVSWQRER